MRRYFSAGNMIGAAGEFSFLLWLLLHLNFILHVCRGAVDEKQ